jgi:hypothetical protein
LNPVIGCLVPPPPWEGILAGVSGKAVSILHRDGALVSVVGSIESMEARALAHPSGFRLFASGASLAADDQDHRISAGWDGRFLSAFHQGEHDSPFAILDFDGAAPWDPRTDRDAGRDDPPVGSTTIDGAIVAIARAIEGARAQGRPAEGIHADGAFRTAFRRLAAEDGFPVNLVGFGPGTTPAGDDWLAGYLAALDALALNASAGNAETDGRGVAGCTAGERARRLRKALAQRLGRTTAAGKALLLGAIAGVMPAYLAQLSRAVLVMESRYADGLGLQGERIVVCATKALRHGATSGEDALAGFVAGLSGR